MSALEYFRKQAKLYLRWHRDGYFLVRDPDGTLTCFAGGKDV